MQERISIKTITFNTDTKHLSDAFFVMQIAVVITHGLYEQQFFAVFFCSGMSKGYYGIFSKAGNAGTTARVIVSCSSLSNLIFLFYTFYTF